MRRIQRDVCHEDLIKLLTSGDCLYSRRFGGLCCLPLLWEFTKVSDGPLPSQTAGKPYPKITLARPGGEGFCTLLVWLTVATVNVFTGQKLLKTPWLRRLKNMRIKGFSLLENDPKRGIFARRCHLASLGVMYAKVCRS